MKKLILISWIVNDEAHYIALNNCLAEHYYLISHHWKNNFRNNIIYRLYCGNNQINNDNIIRSLTK